MINSKQFQSNPFYFVEVIALIAGALVPFSFAPYDLFWLQFPLFALLFLICLEQTPRLAFRRGFAFGLGWFVHGIHWLFYSLYFHGGSPVFLAVLMVVLLAAVLALFPAFAFYLSNRYLRVNPLIVLLVVYPFAIVIFEWLRGTVLTGLPWVQIGIAHIDSPLAGYAPLIGGLGMGLMAMLIAAGLAIVVRKQHIKFVLPGIVFIYLSGYLLSLIQWTQPVGEKIKVSLIQGNIPQSEKWKRENYFPTLAMYRELTRKNWASDLIIWPETAVPGFRSRVTDYLDALSKEAEQNNTEVMLGLFIRDQQTRRYFNSVITLDGQEYRKRHLVPLGEYFPFRPILGFFAQWIDIPLSDIDSGPKQQTMIHAVGHDIGVNICFEDAFDRDVLLDVPQAKIIVNVSNDAWFEDSPQPWQHHQMARVRALETGRSLLRSTNTGVSSVIGAKGEVIAQSPQFQRHVLTTDVQAFQGSTPYVIWANYLLITLLIAGLGYIYKKSNI